MSRRDSQLEAWIPIKADSAYPPDHRAWPRHQSRLVHGCPNVGRRMDVDGARNCKELYRACKVSSGKQSLVSPSVDARATDEDDVGQEQAAGTAAAWATLREAGIVPDNIELKDHMDADAEVIVYEELNNAEILESARAAAADSSDDDEVAHGVLTPVTTSQVMDSLDTIRSFLGAHDDDVDMQLLT